MKSLIYLLIFLLLSIGFFHPVYSITQDLGRHLITGEIIVKTGDVPKVNMFSYTHPNFPFINHHWLSEVLYYISFQKIGFTGLLILNTALVLLSFGLIFNKAQKMSGTLSLLFCSLLYIPILFERTDVRPEFFSFLFLSLFLTILYAYRKNFTKWIFVLPVLELLWVNMHIYFPVGIIIISFFLIDAIISYIKNPNTKIRNSKQTQITKVQNLRHFNHLKIRILSVLTFDIRISSLLLVLFASVFITLLNPNGLKGALYPLSVFQNYGYSIEENQNIFFLWNLFPRQSILFFFIAVPLLFTSLALGAKRVYPVEWLLSIFFTVLAVLSVRNFPLFVFATFILFTKSLSNTKLSLSKHVKAISLIFLLGLAVFEAQQISAKKGFGLGVEKGAKDATDFFVKQNLKGPIFNNFDIGSYLDYRLYPKEKVFVDGRPEAYPNQFFQNDYIPMQVNKSKFVALDQKYNFNTIFFSHTDQTPWAKEFIKQIMENKSWNLVYLDDYAVILTKNKNTSLAAKQVQPKIKTDYSNVRSLIQLASFFQLVNLEDEEIKIYQKVLSIDPASCPVLHNIAIKLQNINDPSFSIFLNKFQKKCQ